MRVSKKFTVVLGALFGLLLLGGVVESRAGSIKNWVSGEVIRSTDLNNNFNHIHNSMVGGHGARLVDSDVSSSAAISISKLSTPALIPRLWAQTSTACTSPTASCPIGSFSGVANIASAVTGFYDVSFSAARPNNSYMVLCTCESASSLTCKISNRFAAYTTVVCVSDTGIATASIFHFMLMDDN